MERLGLFARPCCDATKIPAASPNWIRQELVTLIRRLPTPVIFGHIPLRQVLMAKDRIATDTGCVLGSQLTYLKLSQRQIIQSPGRRGQARVT